jgi:hypothetical protein
MLHLFSKDSVEAQWNIAIKSLRGEVQFGIGKIYTILHVIKYYIVDNRIAIEDCKQMAMHESLAR